MIILFLAPIMLAFSFIPIAIRAKLTSKYLHIINLQVMVHRTKADLSRTCHSSLPPL